MKNLLLRLAYFALRAARPRSHATYAPAHQLQTVIVLQHQTALGNCVHTTPLFAAIKALWPQAKLVVAASATGCAVFRHDPRIDVLLALADHRREPVLAVVRKLRRDLNLRSIAPDLILQDASNRAGSFALIAALLRLAPASGFANAPALYDRHLLYDPNLSLIENNLRLIEGGNLAIYDREPSVFFTPADLAIARNLLGPRPDTTPTVAFVMQGSGGQRTGWLDDRFAAVIRHVESSGARVIFLGTASDSDSIERIRELAGSTGLSLAGQTTIPQLAAVLCLCDLMVTLDTGTMHLGRAVKLPMVILAPCWQPAIEWLPLGLANVRILRGAHRTEVPPGYALQEIDVATVIAAVDDLQRHHPPAASGRAQRAARLTATTSL